MKIRSIVALLLGLSSMCAGQITGRFYLQKETYAPGEPVFLNFEVTNTGADGVNIENADPYSFCSGYTIRVSSDLPDDSSCAPQGFAGSCLSSDLVLPAHKTRTERLLLNYDHKVNGPGYYDVDARRRLGYGDAGRSFYSARHDVLDVQDVLHFRIDESAKADPSEIQKLVAQLRSKDFLQSLDAARALATLAPPAEEVLLLGFAKDNRLRQFAPLALHNLNTPRSVAALAELMVESEAGSYEQMESARYLAETGDRRWFPLLRELALKHGNISNYVAYAAQSGGDEAVPMLLTLMQSQDKEFTAVNAVAALGDTGARSAVPPLIELLRNGNDDISWRALGALQTLTHFQAGTKRYVPHPQEQYASWAKWWAGAHESARIYKRSECGSMSQLPR